MLLDKDALLDRLSSDALDLVALIGSVDLSLPVPSCPGWSLLDLFGHLGSVHHWATEVVRTSAAAEQPSAPREPEVLLPWFAEGAVGVLESLAASVPGTPCWNFGPPPRLVDFWIRRQAIETAVHRWDALTATGASPALDPALAADGIDEVATVLFPRQVRLGRIDALAGTVELVCADTGDRVLIGGDGVTLPAPAATVTGSASDLLLLLWRRLLPDSDGLEVTGDCVAARRVFASALTP
jgi:uncharacterized protein (TIGR03083 family)